MASLKLEIVVDDKGAVKVRQLGDDAQRMGRQAEAGGKQAARGFSDFERQLKGTYSSLLRFGSALAGAYGLGSILRFASSVVKTADETAKMSQRLGISVESLSAYRHMADLSGVSIEQLAVGVGMLSKNLVAAAQGAKSEATEALSALGVKAVDGAGKIRNVDEVLADLAEQFKAMPDGAAKTAYAMHVFGRSGGELIPMLNQGKDGIKGMREEAERLGLVISTETAQAAERVNDNFTRLTNAARGFALQLIDPLLPKLEELTDNLKKAAEGMALFFGQSEKMILQRRQMALVEELDELERLMNEGPSWWDRLKAGATMGESGDVPDNPLINTVYGTKEQWAARKREILVELEDGRAKMREIDSRPAQTPKGGVEVVNTKGLEQAERDREKWLQGYLRDLDKRWDAEVKHNEQMGELYLLDQKARDEAVKKQTEQEAEYFKTLEDIKLAQIEGEIEAREEAGKKAKASYDEMKSAFTGWASNFGRDLNDMLWEADFSFKGIAESFGRMITQMIIQTQVIQPLLSGLFDFIGTVASPTRLGMGSILAEAHGHAYGPAGRYAFQKGGVVKRPTLFRFAAGIGLMGEAGDEAIMPLARTPGGDLGVKAVGGGGQQVNMRIQVINNTGAQAEVRQEPPRFNGQEWICTLWLDAVQRNKYGIRDMLGGQ